MAKESEDQPALGGGEAGGGGGKLWLLILGGVALIGLVGGYGVGQIFGGPADPEPDRSEKAEPSASGGGQELLYHDFDTITVNLNEPNLTRYIRATVTLAVTQENNQVVVAAVDKKRPELRSWLNVYLSGCTLEDVRGPKNLNRIRREILEAFNARLWPDSRPRIETIYLKEFAVQ
jgi:flagellar basal body-associated protein FliL